jgi:TPP-dependent 2-oxoacid decarboxylase
VKTNNVAEYIVERLASDCITDCFRVAGDYVFPIGDLLLASARASS